MTTTAAQKLRGGFYTPKPIADYLVDWAFGAGRAARTLEPSAGDGAILAAIKRRGIDTKVTAFELDPVEAASARSNTRPGDRVIVGDGLSLFQSTPEYHETFDVVVGNPPFVRYQSIDADVRAAGERILVENGMKPNRLTNLWVPFVVMAVQALAERGRLALVLPAELMQVGYAGQLRDYLISELSEITITTFRTLTFPDIQQETLLLTGVKGRSGGDARMSVRHLDSVEQLGPASPTAPIGTRAVQHHPGEKWLRYHLSPDQIALLEDASARPGVVELGGLARVNVGIVTGRNDFFVLRPSEADALGVREHCLPLVGRSAQIPGFDFTHEDWEALALEDSRCLLMQLGEIERASLSDEALKYVIRAENDGVHDGYKCRIRLPRWWNVPTGRVPDGFMLRQIYRAPRIVANLARAHCTDTIHRVFVEDGVDVRALAATSTNALTVAASEVLGRSYGGGVLELEPREAIALPFPDVRLDRFGGLADYADQHDLSFEQVDRLTLLPLGFSLHEIEDLREVWRTLSARRLDRGKALPRRIERAA